MRHQHQRCAAEIKEAENDRDAETARERMERLHWIDKKQQYLDVHAIEDGKWRTWGSLGSDATRIPGCNSPDALAWLAHEGFFLKFLREHTSPTQMWPPLALALVRIRARPTRIRIEVS